MSALLLKLVAYTAMTYDHIGFFNGEMLFRALGRLALPIFCFLIAQGARNSSNPPKYALRILIFAVASEIPFNYFVSGKVLHIAGQNVFWTLLIGLCCILLRRELFDRMRKHAALAYTAVVFVGCMLANFFITDYGYFGVVLIVIFDLFPMHTTREKMLASLGMLGLYVWRFASYGIYLLMQKANIDPMAFTPLGRFFLREVTEWELYKLLALGALPILMLYNGKKGSLGDKSMDRALRGIFYLYYPVHLLLIAMFYRL